MNAIEIRAELDESIPRKVLKRLHRGVSDGLVAYLDPIEAREAINLIAAGAVAEKDRRWRRMVSDELDRIAAVPSEKGDTR